MKKLFTKLFTTIMVFTLVFSPLVPVYAAEVGYAPQTSAASQVVDGIGNANKLSITSASSGNDSSQNKILPSQSHVDESSGAFLYSLPITLPSGRAGLTHSLNLSYDSRRNNPTGYIAKGWELDIPYIQRTNKAGVDLMYDRPDFASSTQGELVKLQPMSVNSLNQSGLYGAKSGIGRYELRNDNSWSMIDTNGITYIYGVTSRDREGSQTDQNKTSQWYLSSMTDTSGNKVEFMYEKGDNGRVYPRSIIYGDGMYRITFEYTTGIIDKLAYLLGTKTDYAAGLRAKSDRQLKTIGVVVNSETRLQYNLVRNNSDVTTTKQNISSITVSDNASINETTSFNYSVAPQTEVSDYMGSLGYGSAFTGLNPGNIMIPDSGTTVVDQSSNTKWWKNQYAPQLYTYADLDGDGWKENIILTPTTINNGFNAYTLTVQGINATKTGYESKPDRTITFQTSQIVPPQVQLADINGDNKIDMLVSARNDYYSQNKVTTFYRNTGNSFAVDTSVKIPDDINATGIYLRDINGDNKADILFTKPAPARTSIYISNGNGFVQDTKYTVLGGKWNPSDQNNKQLISFRDINGDNLEDMIRGTEVFLNRKTYFDYSEEYSLTGALLGTQGALVDINGDMLPDSGNLINTGLGWRYIPQESLVTVIADTSQYGQTDSYPATLLNVVGYYRTISNLGMDMNSDGFLDDLNGNTATLKLHPGTKENIMTSITNPQGGTTSINYGYEPIKNSNTYGSPQSVYVVKSVTTNTAPINTVTYTYTDGLQYISPEELTTKFVGFGTVITVDTEGTKEVSYYHQGNESNTAMGEYQDSQLKIGKEYRTETYDKSNQLARTIITKWNGGDLGTNRSMIFPQTVLTRNTLGGSYDTAVGYTYDTAYGQVVRVSDLGLVNGSNDGSFTDTGSDAQTTNYNYITNGTIVRQSKATRTDQSGKVLAQSAATYDNGILSRGLPTETQQWIDANTINKTKIAYNSYGLPTSTTDALGNTTSTIYDTQNLYPISTTNALGQITTYSYDYMTGKPVRTTDPSSIVMEYTYDAYGRETSAKRNGTAIRSSWYSPTQYSTTNLNTGVFQPFTETATYDGLGRTVYTRSDKNGYVAYEYTPSSRMLTQSVPSNTYSGQAKNTFTYDVLGRQTVISNSQGTSYITYNGLNKSITNPRGVKTDYNYDVRGNLTSVIENGQYTTSYTYDANGNLITLTDAEGNKREFQTNLRGDLLNATDLHTASDTSYGAVKKTYDLLGRVTNVQLQDTKNIATTYDAIGRITKTVTSDETINYAYDNCMKTKLCSVSSTSGISTNYTYTPEGFIATKTQTIDGKSLVKSYTYDNQGQVMSITQPDSTLVNYERQTTGANIRNIKVDGSELIQNVQYDIESRIQNITYTGNTLNTTYTYDPAKMLELRNQKSFTPTGTLVDTTMTYDNNGNAINITENGYAPLKSTKTYTYDVLDRLINYSATGTPTSAESYQYSPTGNILNANTEPYTYGPLSIAPTALETTEKSSLLATVVDFLVPTAYAQTTPPVTCTAPQVLNTTTNTCYTPTVTPNTITMDDVLKLLQSKGIGTQISGRALIKPNYQKVTVTFKKTFTNTPLISATPTAAIGLGVSEKQIQYYLSDITPTSFRIRLSEPTINPITFNYSAMEFPNDDGSTAESEDDLNGITASDIAIAVSENTVPIDAIKTLFTDTAPVTSGTLPPTHSFTSPQAVTKKGGTTYSYDARGNMIGESVATTLTTNGVPSIVQSNTLHTYNSLNQIIKTTLPNGDIITYRYAPDGTRTMKTLTPKTITATSPIKTTIYFDDDYESETNGTVTTTRTRVMLGSVHIATVEKSNSITSIYYQLTNPVGSSTITTDNKGVVIQAQDTKPYGGYRVNTESKPIKDRFGLHERDIESGLTYMQARYYNENQKRFLSLDPTSQYNPRSFLSDPQQLNLYSYARNNPMRYNDPDGRAISDYEEGTPDIGKTGYSLGTVQGTYMGVPIYANGGKYGTKYQCVGFAIAFIKSQYSYDFKGFGNGVDYGDQARYDAKTKDGLGSFKVYQNGGTELPQENDIMSWRNTGSKYGHVGIVVQTDFDTEKGRGTLWTAEQNQGNKKSALRKQTILSDTVNGVTTYTIQKQDYKPNSLVPNAFARYIAPAKSSGSQQSSQSKSGGALSKTKRK